jgi:UDP-glucose 4-epimerase
MADPITDLEINGRSQLSILEAVRKGNPELKIVFAGTRQVYGKPRYLPVDEAHLLNPTDVNGINKIAGELYHLVYNSVYGIRASSLRLTNTYGPRQLIRHNRQGFIGWFVRQATRGEEIQIFGDGLQKRDFNHVDGGGRVLRAGAMDAADGQSSTSRTRARSPCTTS